MMAGGNWPSSSSPAPSRLNGGAASASLVPCGVVGGDSASYLHTNKHTCHTPCAHGASSSSVHARNSRGPTCGRGGWRVRRRVQRRRCRRRDSGAATTAAAGCGCRGPRRGHIKSVNRNQGVRSHVQRQVPCVVERGSHSQRPALRSPAKPRRSCRRHTPSSSPADARMKPMNDGTGLFGCDRNSG
jgi:hypothetical protein